MQTTILEPLEAERAEQVQRGAIARAQRSCTARRASRPQSLSMTPAIGFQTVGPDELRRFD